MRALLLAALLCGCGPTFTLEVTPVVPLNQSDLLAEGDELVMESASGDAVTATWSADGTELPGVRVAAEDQLSIRVSRGGELVAYGELFPLNEDLLRGKQSATVLLAATEQLGNLGNVSPDVSRAGAAVVVTSSGRAFLFGGAEDLDQNATESSVLLLDTLDATSWTFTEAEGLSYGPVVYPSAAVVDVDGRELVLVTGGAELNGGIRNYVDTGLLFDPATLEVIWEGGTDTRHGDALTLVLGNGRVLTVSGEVSTGTTPGSFSAGSTASVELFNPANQRGNSLAPSIAAFGHAGAVLQDGRAVVCGGSTPNVKDGQFTDMAPDARCVIIDGTGDIVPGDAPNLPVATNMHAMGTLADGRVLLVGGVTQNTSISSQGSPATDAAYLWDPAGNGDWTPVGSLTEPRAGAHVLPLPDGRALILGGAATGGPFADDFDAPPRCMDIFDPTTETFDVAPATQCAAAGTGARPSVSLHPQQGVLSFSGISENGGGGGRLGYIPLPTP